MRDLSLEMHDIFLKFYIKMHEKDIIHYVLRMNKTITIIINTQLATGNIFLPIPVDSCDANEVYKSCWNPLCEKTCAMPKVRGKCNISICQSGCYCQSGYVRNKYGRCVRTRDCEALDRKFYFIFLFTYQWRAVLNALKLISWTVVHIYFC